MTRRDIPSLLFLALACVFGVKSCRADAATAEADARLAAMRTEALATRIDSAGWELRIAEATSGLEQLLQAAADSNARLAREKADLATQVEQLGGELRALADVNATLEGRIASLATLHASEDSAVAQSDSITAPLDDGLLRGRVAYFPEPQTFDVSYRVALGMTLGLIEAPDGRQMVTARADDSRVGITFGDVYVQPPEPVVYCSLGRRVLDGLIGAGVGGTVSTILGAWRR